MGQGHGLDATATATTGQGVRAKPTGLTRGLTELAGVVMFTLEVAGKPIAVTNASEDETREIFESDAFKEDLKTVESEGAPIWDGFATLSIRPATRDEIA